MSNKEKSKSNQKRKLSLHLKAPAERKLAPLGRTGKNLVGGGG